MEISIMPWDQLPASYCCSRHNEMEWFGVKNKWTTPDNIGSISSGKNPRKNPWFYILTPEELAYLTAPVIISRGRLRRMREKSKMNPTFFEIQTDSPAPGKGKICSLLSKTTQDGFSMKTPWLTPSFTPPSWNSITISEYRRLLFSLPHGKGAGMTLSRGRNSLTQPTPPSPSWLPTSHMLRTLARCGAPGGHSFFL